MQQEEYRKMYKTMSEEFFKDLDRHAFREFKYGHYGKGYHGRYPGFTPMYARYYGRCGGRGGRFLVPFFGVIAGSWIYHACSEHNHEQRLKRREIEKKLWDKLDEKRD